MAAIDCGPIIAAMEAFWTDAPGLRTRCQEAGALESERRLIPEAVAHADLYKRMIEAEADGRLNPEQTKALASVKALHAQHSGRVLATLAWWAKPGW